MISRAAYSYCLKLRYAGFIESWGYGTIKIVDNCIKQGLPEPDFVEENGVMTVTFYKDKWNQENLRKLGLNVRQVKAVMYVKKNGKITNSDYQELNDVSERTALRDLEALIKKEVLMKKGEKRRPIINWVMADKWRIWRISGG